MRTSIRFLTLALIAYVVGGSGRLSAHDPVGTRVTWAEDIAPIMEARCASCHKAGSQQPMPLTTYDEVRPWVAAIRQQVLSRKMPIWHAVRGFGEFANDPSLSSFEIAVIAAWANAGGPRGSTRPSRPVATPPSRAARKFIPPAAAISRALRLPCGVSPASGTLLGIEPRLPPGGAVTVTVRSPSGDRQIVAWIRDFDPRYPATYWLRQPMALARGSYVEIESESRCEVMATLAR